MVICFINVHLHTLIDMNEPILTQLKFFLRLKVKLWPTLNSPQSWAPPCETKQEKASSTNPCWTPRSQTILFERQISKHTSSRISLFLCSSSGSSLINWSTVWMPPCSITDVDLVNIDWGTVSPDTSSIAAGRLRDANTLKKWNTMLHRGLNHLKTLISYIQVKSNRVTIPKVDKHYQQKNKGKEKKIGDWEN